MAPSPATLGTRMLVTTSDGQTPCYKLDVGLLLTDGARVALFRDGTGRILSRGIVRADGRLELTCEAGTTEPLGPECVPLSRPGVCRPGLCR